MSNTLLVIFGVIVALIVLIVIFRTRGAGEPVEPHYKDDGHGVSDGFSAALEDVVGEFTGVEANPDHPGDTTVRRNPGDGSGGVASTAQGGAGDTLTQIKGLGPKAQTGLKEMGIHRFEQIAGWTAGDIETVSARLGGSFAQRIERDRWVEQAGLLARGEKSVFEKEFGSLG